jgi:hypothetical protein
MKNMKIAIVVPPWFKVPPARYGGIEAIINILANGLVSKGYEVALFTVGKSKSKSRLFKMFDNEMKAYLNAEPSSFLNIAVTHAFYSYNEILKNDYEIIHDNTWKEGLCCAAFIDKPVVHTIHSPIDEENKRFYNLFKNISNIHFVTISDFQQKCLPDLNYAATVHNAVELTYYPYSDTKENFLLYIGRFNPQKAPHRACIVAKKVGMRLILAGKINEKSEQVYFDRYIRKYLSKDIVYLGEVSEQKKLYLFSKATAFLFPVEWAEPFGITLIEAMACGTPVVTFRKGATPEIVEHEKTGYVVNTMAEFVKAVKRVDKIKPYECRSVVEKKFSAQALVNNYEKVYEKVLKCTKK